MTRQRQLLLEIIQSSDTHLDAASLLRLASARDPGIDRTTVYRTLDLLKQLRSSGQSEPSSGRSSYNAPRGADQIRISCQQCGTISDFQSPAIATVKHEIANKLRFQISAMRMEVRGRCQNCASLTPQNDAKG